MINSISAMGPWSSYGVYGASYAGRAAQAQGPDKAQSVQRPSAVWTARRAAQPDTPVQPVTPAKAVGSSEMKPGQFSLNVREGADPVEMAVRMRIRYAGDGPAGQGAAAQAAGADKAKAPELAGLKGTDAQQAADPSAIEAKSAQEVMEEGECQTCKERKYQDGSNETDVSFKAPGHISPQASASTVKAHEQQHVANAYEKAAKNNGKVVSCSVSLRTSVCPECGTSYVAGGTTSTSIAYPNESNPYQKNKKAQDAIRLKGANVDYVA